MEPSPLTSADFDYPRLPDSAEAERLSALNRYEILDSPSERDFDDLARLAAAICQTPIAVIGLLDDTRQWFKSAVGLDASQAPREWAMCNYTIAQDDVFEVQDASQDERFANMPMVRDGLQIRFYAGASLETSDGHRLGSLCVADRQPRALNEQQREALRVLSRQVMAQIEARRRVQQLSHALEAQARSEADLRRSREEFRAMIEGSTDLIYRADANGCFTFFNDTAMRLMGFSRDEMMGMNYLELVRAEFRPRAARFYGRQFARRIPDTYFEFPAQAKDGSTVWFGQNVHLLIENEQVVGFEAVARDITARRRAQDELRASEKRYRTVVEDLQEVIFQTDAGVNWTFLNPAWTRITGFSVESSLGRNALEWIHPDDRHRATEGLQVLAARQRDEYRFTMRLRTSENRDNAASSDSATSTWEAERVVEVATRAVFDANDTFVGLNGTLNDVTERQRAQDALKASEAELRTLFSAMQELVISIDSAGRFVKIAPTNPNLLYRPADTLIGKRVQEVFSPQISDLFMNTIAHVLESGERQHIEYDLEIGSNLLNFEASVAPLPDGNVLWVVRDISEQREAVRRIKEFSRGLRTVLDITDELLQAPDVDTLLERTVELSRQRLGLERAAIFLCPPDQSYAQGTFGTDLSGQTTDERAARLEIPDGRGYRNFFRSHDFQDDWKDDLSAVRWNIERSYPLHAIEGDHYVPTDQRGEVAVAFIQTNSGLLGSFHNDNALTGQPLNGLKQELVAVLVSVLGTLIERKRAEGALREARDELELRVQNRTAQLSEANRELKTEIAERLRAQQQEAALSRGLRTILSCADELLHERDFDDLLRRAVELAHERLGLERSAIFLFDETCAWAHGTYGVNMQGEITAQSGNSLAMRPGWDEAHSETQMQSGARWRLVGDDTEHWDWCVTSNGNGAAMKTGTRGWIVETPIRGTHGLVGILFNDNAIKRQEIDPAQQEIVALYASLLGNLIETQRAQDALVQSNLRFRTLTEALPQLVWILNSEGKIEYLNHEALAYFGIDSLSDFDDHAVMHPDEIEPIARLWQNAQQTQRAFDFEYRIRNAQGEFRWHLARVLPLQNAGETVRWIGSATDIEDQKRAQASLRHDRDDLERRVLERTRELSTSNLSLQSEINERRQTEIALRHSEERFRAFMNASTFVAYMKTEQGQFVYLNDSLCRSFNITPNEWLGKTDFDVLAPEIAQAVRANDLQVLAGDTTQELVEIVPVAEGMERIWLSFKFPLHDSEGHKFLAGISFDITEQKRAERELQRATDELRRSNADLEQFAYVASHDLQEPLRMVVSYLQLLERRHGDKLEGDAHDFIEYAVDGARRMQNLINDLLEYSRVDRKERQFNRVALEKSLAHALLNLKVAIEESDAHISYDPLPQVLGDGSQITRVLQNLIGNAIKFRGEEAPHVHIECRDAGDFWHFEVRDNGIGIAPQHHERIFAVFQRLHSRQEYPGTGIGLAVVKRIIERHGGQIGVSSEANQGATFWFTLPKLETSNPELKSMN